MPSGDAVNASAKASISCVKQRAMRPLKSRHSTIRTNRKATMGTGGARQRSCPRTVKPSMRARRQASAAESSGRRVRGRCHGKVVFNEFSHGIG